MAGRRRQLENNSGAATVGERIRRVRRDRGLTQTELAAKANVNQGYLSSIERGHRVPRPATLRAIAVTLGVPDAVLLGEGDGHDAPQALETRQLPIYGSIPSGPPSQSQEQLEMFPVLRHLWHADRYCLRCEFDSMEPTLKRGDIILVDYRPGVKAASRRTKMSLSSSATWSASKMWPARGPIAPMLAAAALRTAGSGCFRQ